MGGVVCYAGCLNVAVAKIGYLDLTALVVSELSVSVVVCTRIRLFGWNSLVCDMGYPLADSKDCCKLMRMWDVLVQI